MKYVIVNRGVIVGRYSSKEEAEMAANEMRIEAIIAKIRDEWGENPNEVSEKRWREAATDIGRDGNLFQVVPLDEANDFLEEEY